MIDEVAVNGLLSASRAAHEMKKRRAGVIDSTGATIAPANWAEAEHHLVEALRLRLDAHDLDPEHTASGWLVPIPPAPKPTPEPDLIRFYVAYSKPFIPEHVMARVLERFPVFVDVRYIP